MDLTSNRAGTPLHLQGPEKCLAHSRHGINPLSVNEGVCTGLGIECGFALSRPAGLGVLMAGLAVSLVSPAWDGLRKGRVLAQPSPRVSPPLLELALARLSALTLNVPQWDGVGRGGDGE